VFQAILNRNLSHRNLPNNVNILIDKNGVNGLTVIVFSMTVCLSVYVSLNNF
jgi:hypothetical protein